VASHSAPLAEAAGLVSEARGASARSRRRTKFSNQSGDVEREVVAVELADLQEVGVLPRDVGQLADGGPSAMASLAVGSPRHSFGVEVEVAFSRSSSHSRRARSSCDSHDSVFQRRLYSGCSIRRMFGSASIEAIRRSTSVR